MDTLTGDKIMSALLPALARAAGVGAVLGLGIELMARSKGILFVISVVASVALRAAAWYFGAAASVGAVAGVVFSLVVVNSDSNPVSVLGGAFFGAALGYLSQFGWPG